MRRSETPAKTVPCVKVHIHTPGCLDVTRHIAPTHRLKLGFAQLSPQVHPAKSSLSTPKPRSRPEPPVAVLNLHVRAGFGPCPGTFIRASFPRRICGAAVTRSHLMPHQTLPTPVPLLGCPPGFPDIRLHPKKSHMRHKNHSCSFFTC